MTNMLNIRPVEVELFHVDRRRTDMTILIIDFRNFETAAKKG